MKHEIVLLSAALHGEKLGIETLEKLQAFKAKVIAQAHKTVLDVKEHKKRGAIALSWADEAWAFFVLLGQSQKIAKEWEDLDAQEKQRLQDYFIECLRKEGFEAEEPELMHLVAATNKYILDTQDYFKLVAEFVKK